MHLISLFLLLSLINHVIFKRISINSPQVSVYFILNLIKNGCWLYESWSRSSDSCLTSKWLGILFETWTIDWWNFIEILINGRASLKFWRLNVIFNNLKKNIWSWVIHQSWQYLNLLRLLFIYFERFRTHQRVLKLTTIFEYS